MRKKKQKNNVEPINYVFDDTGYNHLMYEFYTPTYDFKLDYVFIEDIQLEDFLDLNPT